MTLKFDEVFSIMKKSFPQEEMRNYEGQKAIKGYEKLVKMDVNKQVKINRSPQLKP